MVSHWSLSDSKSPQVSRTRFRILVNLNNAVIWMVSTHPLISKSSSPLINLLVTVPSGSFTTSITVTFMFHSFFSSLERSKRSRYLFFFSLSFSFILGTARMAKSTIWQVIIFLLTFTRSGCLAEIRWSISIYIYFLNDLINLILVILVSTEVFLNCYHKTFLKLLVFLIFIFNYIIVSHLHA